MNEKTVIVAVLTGRGHLCKQQNTDFINKHRNRNSYVYNRCKHYKYLNATLTENMEQQGVSIEVKKAGSSIHYNFKLLAQYILLYA